MVNLPFFYGLIAWGCDRVFIFSDSRPFIDPKNSQKLRGALYTKQGIEQGEMMLLDRMLTKRFGELPSAIEMRLSQASIADLELWSDRVFKIGKCDRVFIVARNP